MSTPTGSGSSKLFGPLHLGGGPNGITLSHRAVMVPMTRLRAANHVPNTLMAQYYGQRATPGGLIISEAIMVSAMAGNYYNVPGIYTAEQVREVPPA